MKELQTFTTLHMGFCILRALLGRQWSPSMACNPLCDELIRHPDDLVARLQHDCGCFHS